MSTFFSHRKRSAGFTLAATRTAAAAAIHGFPDRTAGRTETSMISCKEGVQATLCPQRGIYGRSFFVGHIRGLDRQSRGTDPGGTGSYEATTPLYALSERDGEPGRVAAVTIPPVCSAPLNLSRFDDQGDHQ